MPLAPGSSLGPYEIIAPLGAGGMGEVYRARDTRLGREVAVKVLPASFTADADRLRRFEQEARATGMLNHPNILVVHDFGTHAGSPYLVTELLEGQTLREELPIARRKALDYARQIATGLAAAHTKGVSHRDLKPENLFVTSDGRVKILDFGLAKVAVPEEDSDLTRSVGTTPGVTLGTVGYMSPEQALGKASDTRSDIFSLGAILYEMFSGVRAFHAPSGIETLNAILKADPPPLDDAALDRIVRRCLEKSPEQRFQSAADLSFALEALSQTTSTVVQATPAVSRKPAGKTLTIAAGVVIVLAAAVAVGLWWQARQDAAAAAWTGLRLGGPDIVQNARISPNGQSMAFITDVEGQCQVGVMNPSSGDWSTVTHERMNGYAWNLAWSRDSSKIYFERASGSTFNIYSVSALGGDEQMFMENARDPTVLPDGSMTMYRLNADRKAELHRYWPQNGRLEPLGAEMLANFTSRGFSDGKTIVFYGRPTPSPKPESPFGYYALDLASKKMRQLAPQMENPIGYAATLPGGASVLLTRRAGDLTKIVEVPLHGMGSERPVLDWRYTYQTEIEAAPDGSIYIDEIDRPTDVLRFSTSGGVIERTGGSALGVGSAQVLQLQDGRAIFPVSLAGHIRLHAAKPGKNATALVQTDEDTNGPMAVLGASNLVVFTGKLGDPSSWMLAVVSLSDGRIVRRIESTKGAAIDGLSPSIDGKTLYYSASGSIFSMAADGTGQATKVAAADGVLADPNGRDFILFRNEKDAAHLYRVPIAGGAEHEIPIPANLHLVYPPPGNAVSKDGRILLTVDSIDSCWERTAILDPATGKAERVPVSFAGDIWNPGWTPDGRILVQGVEDRTALWRLTRDKK